jgi:tetratricopeptide (TPR) repeat protein
MDCDAQTKLDLALDFARAGFYQGAVDLLATLSPSSAAAEEGGGEGLEPLIDYYRAYFLDRLDKKPAAAVARTAAKNASPDYCFPSRLDDIFILQAAIDADPSDARAPYYLGNLYYDRRRHIDAIALWEKSTQLDPTFSIVWRNLGIAYFNIKHDAAAAKNAYERAFAANPDDARLLYELDQLRKRIGESPEHRLAELERHIELVNRRDDLSVELCALYNQVGKHDQAMNILKNRRFQPWEGGEGLVLGQHVRTHLSLGRLALRENDAKKARFLFAAAANCPKNLGEARHLLANQSEIFYWIGVASKADGNPQAAEVYWSAAANARGDFQEMGVRAFSESTYLSALALRSLGREVESEKLLRDLLDYARKLAKSPAKIDYFATSLPAMLLFDDDLQHRQTIHARFLEAQAHLGLGEKSLAEKSLKEILRDDPNYTPAADLLSSLNTEETHANR